MFKSLSKKIFGTPNDRYIKTLLPTVAQINALEPDMQALSDDALKEKTAEFRARLAEGATLDDLLVEAFATVREASRRATGMRHFDVQLMGGIVLHRGEISEMRTGEGKTLTATLPCYLHALSGKGAHVVTVNDYLAQRDSAEMGEVFAFLGMTTGCIHPGVEDDKRQAQYAADITYATNNEIGFDYLRDNMKFRLEDMVQRGFNFAIVDEVDSILIDEARTPLIISGPADDGSEGYQVVDKLIAKLDESDFELNEKERQVIYTEDGVLHMESLMVGAGLLEDEGSLYDSANVGWLHHANQALRAHKLFTRDKDYMIKAKEVVIIDEFTGRAMEGRRFSDGLHQALEAKEGVPVKPENQTQASITFQNLFRMYKTLSGMTGTAMTEAEEFGDIYKLDVVELPTNEPMIRDDRDDEIYRTGPEKNQAIIFAIKEAHARQQPTLVGTVTIEKSEGLSRELKAAGIPHNVLNARFHEQEAMIIGQAGQPGAVTIATNMAGRGTDIQLGGNLGMRMAHESPDLVPGTPAYDARAAELKAEIEINKQIVKDAGGLFVIGTERHESRRIDNQLRGRSGRQGDPGASQFYLSLDDDLMRIFAPERMNSILKGLGLKDGEAIIHPWMNKAIERAQTRVESRNYDIRKNLLKFDNVMNDQRKVIYEKRRHFMESEDVSGEIKEMRDELIEDLIYDRIPNGSYADQWDIDGLREDLTEVAGVELPVAEWAAEEGIAEEELQERITDALAKIMAKKEAQYGAGALRFAEKSVALQLLDSIWKEHLLTLIQLRDGIGLRAYGQRDPLNEYKQESFDLFEDMMGKVRRSVISYLSRLEFREPSIEEQAVAENSRAGIGGAIEGEIGGGEGADLSSYDLSTVPRNAACPCGSGKKFKHCHGRVA